MYRCAYVTLAILWASTTTVCEFISLNVLLFCCSWELLPLSAEEEIRTPVWEHMMHSAGTRGYPRDFKQESSDTAAGTAPALHTSTAVLLPASQVTSLLRVVWCPAGVLCAPTGRPRLRQGLCVGTETPAPHQQTPRPSWGPPSLLHSFWPTNHLSWKSLKHTKRKTLVLTNFCYGLMQRPDSVNLLMGKSWLGELYCWSRVTFSEHAINAFVLCRGKSENSCFGLITQIIWKRIEERIHVIGIFSHRRRNLAMKVREL